MAARPVGGVRARPDVVPAAKTGYRRPAGAGHPGNGRSGSGVCSGNGVRRSRGARNVAQLASKTHWPNQKTTPLRERDAVKDKAKEREQTELAEQRLYDFRMNLVQRYWEAIMANSYSKGSTSSFRQPGGIDRRGFEWFYWQRKISSGHITLKGHTSLSKRGVQPRRQAARLRQSGRDGEGVGRRDRAGNPHPQGAHRPVTSVAFSPDGQRIASELRTGQ